MPITIEQVSVLIKIDYLKLCERLGLKPLHIAVRTVIEDTPNIDPGYMEEHIEMPVLNRSLQDYVNVFPTFPPTEWDRDSEQWPFWRTELWHETVHQVQSQILQQLYPKNSSEANQTGWNNAILYFVEAFNVSEADIRNVI